MTNTPKIEPALTPEEWDARKFSDQSSDVSVVWGGGGLYVGGYLGQGLIHFHEELDKPDFQGRSVHALIALANAALPDTDPRKITREKIEHMKAIAESIRPTISNESHIGFLDELATALESYLPPPA